VEMKKPASLLTHTSACYLSAFHLFHLNTKTLVFQMAAYLLIRNIPGYFRSGFSSFFAWFGKIYLELFIAQYHIWLAADGKGVLVMIASDWPMLNLIFTTLVFVCVSHEINCLTNIFTYWYIGALQNKLRQLITRIFLLLAVILFFVIVNDVTNSRSVSWWKWKYFNIMSLSSMIFVWNRSTLLHKLAWRPSINLNIFFTNCSLSPQLISAHMLFSIFITNISNLNGSVIRRSLFIFLLHVCTYVKHKLVWVIWKILINTDLKAFGIIIRSFINLIDYLLQNIILTISQRLSNC